MIPAGAAGTPSGPYRVARGAADDVAGRLRSALTAAQEKWPSPVPDGLYDHEVTAIVGALLPVVEQIAEERARQRAADAVHEAAELVDRDPTIRELLSRRAGAAAIDAAVCLLTGRSAALRSGAR